MSKSIDSVFAALANPTRRAILSRLALGETSVTELAEPFQMSLPAVSKHLRVLERARLISRGRKAQFRPCKLKPQSLRQASEWFDGYKLLWEKNTEALEIHAEEKSSKKNRSKKHKKRGRHRDKK